MVSVWLLWAWCRLAEVGMAPSAAGGNINPPVGRRVAGAHGQQLARLEVEQLSVDWCICVCCVCPELPSDGPVVSEHLWVSLTLCAHALAECACGY